MSHDHSAPHTHEHAAHVNHTHEGHAPSCACGHDHAHAPAAEPKLSAPLSLISSGSPVRLVIAGAAIVGLWAVTWWALGA